MQPPTWDNLTVPERHRFVRTHWVPLVDRLRTEDGMSLAAARIAARDELDRDFGIRIPIEERSDADREALAEAERRATERRANARRPRGERQDDDPQKWRDDVARWTEIERG